MTVIQWNISRETLWATEYPKYWGCFGVSPQCQTRIQMVLSFPGPAWSRPTCQSSSSTTLALHRAFAWLNDCCCPPYPGYETWQEGCSSIILTEEAQLHVSSCFMGQYYLCPVKLIHKNIMVWSNRCWDSIKSFAIWNCKAFYWRFGVWTNISLQCCISIFFRFLG